VSKGRTVVEQEGNRITMLTAIEGKAIANLADFPQRSDAERLENAARELMTTRALLRSAELHGQSCPVETVEGGRGALEAACRRLRTTTMFPSWPYLERTTMSPKNEDFIRFYRDAVIAGHDDPAAETMRHFNLSRDYIVRLLNETIAGCEGQDIRNWKSGER
jgi:hypothetical protein